MNSLRAAENSSADTLHMVVHAAADIEEQQHPHRVAPLRLHAQVQRAGVRRGGMDGAGQVQLRRGAGAGEAAQAAQRHLHVAGAKLQRVVQVAELALVPHLHRPAMAAPDPGRCERPRGCSHGRRTARSPPCRPIWSRPGAAPSARRGVGAASPSACRNRRSPRSAPAPPWSAAFRPGAAAIPRGSSAGDALGAGGRSAPSRPLKQVANTRSKRSRCRSSFTSAARLRK